jgi:hypothetical protein
MSINKPNILSLAKLTLLTTGHNITIVKHSVPIDAKNKISIRLFLVFDLSSISI